MMQNTPETINKLQTVTFTRVEEKDDNDALMKMKRLLYNITWHHA
jgi:hypothetical protein